MIRAILSGATIIVSELPACIWRYESFPGMSMSKPLCPWCLIVPMSYPHSTSFATICSMSVVLPELWRPTKLIAGLSLSKHVVLWEVYATIVRVLELIAGAKICKQLRKHAYACTYWYCIVAWAICVVHRIIFCVTEDASGVITPFYKPCIRATILDVSYLFLCLMPYVLQKKKRLTCFDVEYNKTVERMQLRTLFAHVKRRALPMNVSW